MGLSVNFNTAMDRRHLNMAGRVLDPLGPLSHLWQSAISAEAEGTAMIGNASHCALVDRRKGLLAKVSPDCLDLVDDPELFTPGDSDLFGKRFKKAIFKDLKLTTPKKTNHLSLFVCSSPEKAIELQSLPLERSLEPNEPVSRGVLSTQRKTQLFLIPKQIVITSQV